MIGNGYWSTGITVRYRDGSGWSARARYLDDGFSGDDDPARGIVSTEGVVHTRYYLKGDDGLAAAIDAVKRDAERLGIQFATAGGGIPYLWYEGNDENKEWPPPGGWEEELAQQAARIGWRFS